MATSSVVSANSFGFDQALLTPQEGGVSVRVLYDFSDFAMFGGSVDIIYDHNAIEFERFDIGLFPMDAELALPVGEFTEPGLIEGFGLRTTNFFEGISSQGTLGTFYFTLIG